MSVNPLVDDYPVLLVYSHVFRSVGMWVVDASAQVKTVRKIHVCVREGVTRVKMGKVVGAAANIGRNDECRKVVNATEVVIATLGICGLHTAAPNRADDDVRPSSGPHRCSIIRRSSLLL